MNFGAKQHRSKPKSFQERQDSRVRKSKSERKTKENQLDDAKQFVDIELADILCDMTDPILKKCDDLLLSLSNLPTLLEKFKIEVDGKERPMIQLGAFTRPSKAELHFLPMAPSLVNHIIHKLTKFDHYLRPARSPDGKVVIALPRITTKRREDIIYQMHMLEGQTVRRISDKRKFVLSQIKEVAPNLDHQNEMILTSEADEKLKNGEIDFKSKIEDRVYDAKNITTDADFEDQESPIDAP